MRPLVILLALLGLGLARSAPQSEPAPRPMLAEPAISPDRAEIAFVSGGDIWTVPAAGGEARLLVAHAATESRPLYAPDGRRLAFISTRSGNGDIYVLTLSTGALARITFDDQLDQLDAWSADGRWLYFSSGSRDITGQNDIFRVSAEGGTPMTVSGDRYVNEYWAAPSPDGQQLAMTAKGTVSGQWWRLGHSHLDESELWVLRDATTMRYERLSTGGSKDEWPMWGGGADRTSLFFISERDGAQNVYVRTPAGAVRPVTSFRGGHVLWPNISYDGRTIVFERDFCIWALDTQSWETHEVSITLRGTSAAPAVEHLTLSANIQELALSPDGRKVAFVVHGEVFSASARDGGDATRVTTTSAREQQIVWAPNSRQLAYVSDRNGTPELYLYDFATRTETPLTQSPTGDVTPRFSPDGSQIAFQRGGNQLCVVSLATRRVQVLATGELDRLPFPSDRPIAWSPDGRWLAYLSTSGRHFGTVFVVPATGGASRPVSFLANVFANTISWSPDGTFLLFDTGQRTEPTALARIDLIPRTPRFREAQFDDLFRVPRTPPAVPRDSSAPNVRPAPARDTSAAGARAGTADSAAAANRPVTIVFDDIRRRLSQLPVGVDVGDQQISADGKFVLLTASAAGQRNLYTYSLDEMAREEPVARQVTSTAGFKSDVQLSQDGKEAWYLEGGRITVATLESRTTRTLAVTAEMDVDFSREKLQVFDEAWRYLRDGYNDSAMNGVDWGAIRARYAPYAAGARTPDELRRMLSLLVGELNSSHSGIGAPAPASPPYTGRIGLSFDRAEYERSGRLRIARVLPLSPAALGGDIAAGDYLVAVDGARLDARTNLDSLLAYRIGRRVRLSVSRNADGSGAREVAVRPVNAATERGLMYRQWVEERRAYVARVSGGRLGYVHMLDMGAGSLSQLFTDLDVENMGREGVVIDVRHNNGGFVNAYAIDVFARHGYMSMTYRGSAGPVPARTILGQRSLERPTILVTDQHSLSDAEDFTEGYRSLHLGSVVGEPTAGWIIYTSNVGLIDGTTVRIPFIQIRGSDGQVMEMHPRPVDIPVDRPVGESYGDHDVQLDAAVRELLRQLGGGR